VSVRGQTGTVKARKVGWSNFANADPLRSVQRKAEAAAAVVLVVVVNLVVIYRAIDALIIV